MIVALNAKLPVKQLDCPHRASLETYRWERTGPVLIAGYSHMYIRTVLRGGKPDYALNTFVRRVQKWFVVMNLLKLLPVRTHPSSRSTVQPLMLSAQNTTNQKVGLSLHLHGHLHRRCSLKHPTVLVSVSICPRFIRRLSSCSAELTRRSSRRSATLLLRSR